MKPDEINAIICWRNVGDLGYMSIHEAGEKLRSDVLSWIVHNTLANNLNLLYYIDGGENRIGSKEFLNANLSAPPIPQPEVI
jgi:hypothetical protein